MAERLDYINERMLHTFQCFTPVLTLHDSKGPHAGGEDVPQSLFYLHKLGVAI